MVVTVSTVKDTLANVQRFVIGNLAGGADHMFIFLDDPAPEVKAWLDTRPEVTVVVCDETWWTEGRPPLLNRRQNINANLVKALLSLVDWADWVFHIDADEIIAVNRRRLDRVAPEELGVRLLPLEAISQLHWDGPPTLFKRRLNPEELSDLQARGVIAEPLNSLYFRSHVIGKAGFRPTLDLWSRIHHVVDVNGERLTLLRDPGFRLLHLEAYSGEEFVRKWTTMIGSGPEVHFGKERQLVADEIRGVLGLDAPADHISDALTQIYLDRMEDPLPLLQDLGLVVEADPLGGDHRPRKLRGAQRDQMRRWLDRARTVRKGVFMDRSATRAMAIETLASITLEDRPVPSRFRGVRRILAKIT